MEFITDFLNSIKKALWSITNYKDTSIRSEYFYWYLFIVIISFIMGIIIGFIMEFVEILGEVILSIFLAFIFVVSLPLGIRRLRDIGKSPWFILIGLIPFAGPIILLVFFCKYSKHENSNIGKKYMANSGNDLIEEKSL